MWRTLLICLLALNPTTAAKCKAAPQSVQNVPVCCHAPMPDWGVYSSECSGAGAQPSCRLECIFKAAEVLRGAALNLTQVRPMLERAFNDGPTIEAYQANFASCASLVGRHYQELTKLSKQSDACDRHALFYSLCAYSRLLRHCPANGWQSSNKQCQSNKAYLSSCPWPALKMFMAST